MFLVLNGYLAAPRSGCEFGVKILGSADIRIIEQIRFLSFSPTRHHVFNERVSSC